MESGEASGRVDPSLQLIMEPHAEIRKYWGTEGDPEDLPNWVDEEAEED